MIEMKAKDAKASNGVTPNMDSTQEMLANSANPILNTIEDENEPTQRIAKNWRKEAERKMARDAQLRAQEIQRKNECKRTCIAIMAAFMTLGGILFVVFYFNQDFRFWESKDILCDQLFGKNFTGLTLDLKDKFEDFNFEQKYKIVSLEREDPELLLY